MGLLENGKWIDKWYDTKKSKGRFIRKDSQFRNWVSKEKNDDLGVFFKAQSNRYHLYVSLACPWAHRTLIFRNLKNLDKIISLSVVHWYMGKNGWTFQNGEGVIKDVLNNFNYLYEIYLMANPNYSGRVTVPILWDKEKKTIVSNESSEIIRMFNSEFNHITGNELDFYPKKYRKEIDLINDRIYSTINNGVYKCGFATTQVAYNEAIEPMFETLEWLEKKLDNKRYLLGDFLTEADWRLFTTLIRFDAVYYNHFKCNKFKISEFKNLSNYLRELYQYPGISDTVNMKHIKGHYFESHDTINPTRIVPLGPVQNFNLPHNRNKVF